MTFNFGIEHHRICLSEFRQSVEKGCDENTFKHQHQLMIFKKLNRSASNEINEKFKNIIHGMSKVVHQIQKPI